MTVTEPKAMSRAAAIAYAIGLPLALLALVFLPVGRLDWLPETCAYRLRAAGKPLPGWHYLISGDRETVHEAGQSTRGWTVSEEDAGALEYHVVERAL